MIWPEIKMIKHLNGFFVALSRRRSWRIWLVVWLQFLLFSDSLFLDFLLHLLEYFAHDYLLS